MTSQTAEPNPAKLLEALGPDADAMAESLRRLGVKGCRRKSGEDCVLQRYLEQMGFVKVTVSGVAVGWGDGKMQYLSGASHHFVRQFDVGAYPFLVEDENAQEVA